MTEAGGTWGGKRYRQRDPNNKESIEREGIPEIKKGGKKRVSTTRKGRSIAEHKNMNGKIDKGGLDLREILATSGA